ncbi:MAG: hypothetical protein VW270_10475 [Candidatus Poseidoniales archaeon]
MSDSKYSDYIDAVLKEIPEASADDIHAAFEKYENEFYIPPQDALRSVLRKFQSDSDAPSQAKPRQQRQTKKVAQLSELGSEDKDVEIEVMVVTHNLRQQLIRGEERQIAFGMLQDLPWENEEKRTQWEYKDWGSNSQLLPGSIVRIEGASVNEYNGKRSLNINQSSRIVLLQEGTGSSLKTEDPIDISALPNEGYVTVVGRVLSTKNDQIHRKDGSGSIDVVRGRIADNSGHIGFLSWEPFSHEEGSLIKITGAQVRSFRDTPELNFGRTTKIEPYHDSKFASVDDLKESSFATISDLRDGSRDTDIVVQVTEIMQRKFERDGQEKHLWSAQVIDPTGQCKMTIWDDISFSEKDLPVFVKVNSARITAWQGIPDITVDSADQLSILNEPAWEGEIDPNSHFVEASLDELAAGGSRVGIQTKGIIVSIKEDSGIISRCPECRRVMREGSCYEHGETEGVEDIRLRLIMDDNGTTSSLLVNKDVALKLSEMSESDFKTSANEGHDGLIMHLRSRLLTNFVEVKGRTIVDEQGMMIIATDVEIPTRDPQLRATELRAAWGWN